MTTGICRGDHAKPHKGCSGTLATAALVLRAVIVSTRKQMIKQDVDLTVMIHQSENSDPAI
jgi:hypothetical protein